MWRFLGLKKLAACGVLGVKKQLSSVRGDVDVQEEFHSSLSSSCRRACVRTCEPALGQPVAPPRQQWRQRQGSQWRQRLGSYWRRHGSSVASARAAPVDVPGVAAVAGVQGSQWRRRQRSQWRQRNKLVKRPTRDGFVEERFPALDRPLWCQVDALEQSLDQRGPVAAPKS